MLDVIASRVHGLVVAKEVRVVWTDGWLYIAKSPTDIVALACEEPKKNAGSWKARVGDEALRFQPPGCGSCKRRVMASPVGQMSVAQIVAAANVDEHV